MTECNFRQHKWEPHVHQRPGYERVDLTCKICGVGHRFENTAMPGGQRADITIFPATGQRSISREAILWAIYTCDGTI